MGHYQTQGNDIPSQPNDSTPIISTKQSKKCCGDGFKVLVIGLIIFSAAVTIGLLVDIYYLRKPLPHSGVVTSAPECTQIAYDILDQNDNAVDAAIAAMMCLAVVRPDQCSLASGGFMLFHSTDGPLIGDKSLDFQFTAPKNIKDLQHEVAIPGLLDGLKAAHKLYGSLAFPKLLEPSIRLAADGFVVANSTAANLKILPNKTQEKYFVNGKLVKAGETLKLKTLSETLTRLMYANYSIGDDIMKKIASSNGNSSLTEADFDNYKPVWRKPLEFQFSKDTKVVSTSVPSTGVLLLSALQVLKQFPQMNTSRLFQVTAADLQVTLPRVAALQDPAFDAKQQNLTKRILSNAKYYAQDIEDLLKVPQSSASTPPSDGTKTKSSAGVSIVNMNGDAVSIVSSLGDIFGSKIVSDAGVVLNNGLSLFSKKNQRNIISSKKRPVSYAAPSFIVTDGSIRAFSPSPDKEGLVSAIQVMKNMLLTSLKDEDAITYPRVYSDEAGHKLLVEGKRFLQADLKNTLDQLKSRFSVQDVESIGSVDAVIKHEVTESVQDNRQFS